MARSLADMSVANQQRLAGIAASNKAKLAAIRTPGTDTYVPQVPQSTPTSTEPYPTGGFPFGGGTSYRSIYSQMNQPTKVPTDTFGGFNDAIQTVLKNRFAAGDQQYGTVGANALQGSFGLQSQLADIPGFAGLRLDQARRLSDLESGGLKNMYEGAMKGFEGRQKSFANLQDLATKAYESTAGVTNKDMAKRRKEAMDDFNKIRDYLIKIGVSLDPAIGPAYATKINTSDNPDNIVADYVAAATNSPKVIAAISRKLAKKSGKGGIKGLSSDVILRYGAAGGDPNDLLGKTAYDLTQEQSKMTQPQSASEKALSLFRATLPKK